MEWLADTFEERIGKVDDELSVRESITIVAAI